MKTVTQLIDDIIRREGGYVNHPADKGGPTNWGITQATLASWRGHSVSAADVQALTQDEARSIYLKRYFQDADIDQLPEALQAQAFDINVNGGLKAILGRLTTYFKATPHEIVDFLGPKTANILLAASRVEYYRRIVLKNKSQGVFLAGWLNRNAEFTEWES